MVARDYHPADLHESITQEALLRRKADDPPSDCLDDPLSCQRTVRRQLAQAMIPGPALVFITMDRKAFEMRTHVSKPT